MRQMTDAGRRLAAALAVVAALGGASQAGAQTAESSALQPGDVLRITVWRKPELSGEFRIMADGAIGHPLYQALNVRGLALPALTTRLREFLATYEQNPQVVAEPLLRVAVGGGVHLPNLYLLPAGTSLSQAVAQAGGADQTGNLAKVRLLRAGRVERINLTDARSGAAAMPVQSGDEILVGQRGNVFRDVIGPFASILAAAAAIVSATQ